MLLNEVVTKVSDLIKQILKRQIVSTRAHTHLYFFISEGLNKENLLILICSTFFTMDIRFQV